MSDITEMLAVEYRRGQLASLVEYSIVTLKTANRYIDLMDNDERQRQVDPGSLARA